MSSCSNDLIGVNHRNQFADSLRGIAAVLVVVGHLLIRDASSFDKQSTFLSFIYCVHMPVFFFFAEFFAHNAFEKNGKSFVREKSLRLLVPYAAWSCVAVGAKAILNIVNGCWKFSEFINDIWMTLLSAESVWFFLALFWMQMLFYVLNRITKKHVLPGVLVAVVIYLLPLPNTLALHHMQEMIPSFALGILVARNEWMKKVQCSKAAMIMSILVVLTSPLYVCFVYAHRLAYGISFVVSGILELMVAISVGTLGGFILRKVDFIGKHFGVLGKYSMEIYCIHMFFVKYIPLTVPKSIIRIPIIAEASYCILGGMIAWLCVFLSWAILNRVPLYRKLMLGRWKRK